MSSYDRSFSRRLNRWLEKFGLIADPFALYEADRERSDLPYFFVDRPYLHDMIGVPEHPQPAFLLAGRGAGKTATREMVAYECSYASMRRRALPVRYYDFAPLLEQTGGDLTQITIGHHVRLLARQILKAMIAEIPATYFDLLDDLDRGILMGYVAEFGDPISRLKWERILTTDPLALEWEKLSPSETLQTLANLVVKLGRTPDSTYQALYVLVDRVDETAAGPDAAVALLRPLVADRLLLETEHVAFKFFIPEEVGRRLEQVVDLRPDRVCICRIRWDADALRAMVEQRISYYSEGRTERLEEMCTPGAKSVAMDRMIRACEGSPRRLLRLCRALIHHHVQHAKETNTLITHKDLVGALQEFEHQMDVEHAPKRSEAMPAADGGRATESTTPPSEPPARGLYIDTGGHVWVDGRPLAPPLPALEFRLLKILYQHAPNIVPHQALIEAVWPPAVWMSSDHPDAHRSDEQNLRKLIGRLRERLEPESSGRESRFVKNVRGRGYWLCKD